MSQTKTTFEQAIDPGRATRSRYAEAEVAGWIRDLLAEAPADDLLAPMGLSLEPRAAAAPTRSRRGLERGCPGWLNQRPTGVRRGFSGHPFAGLR